MKRGTLISLAALAALPASFAAAKEREPEVLKRTGKWVVDFDRDRCNTFAQFGEGEQMVVARFTRYEPGDHFTLSLYGARLRTADVRVEVKLNYGSGKPTDGAALSGTAGKLPALFFSSGRIDGWTRKAPDEVAPAITPAQEATVKGLTVDVRGKAPFRLDFGSLAGPLRVMRQCTSDLVKGWGYDPEVQAHLSRPVTPVGSPARWLNSDDYPVGAMSMGRSGFVQLRLDVDTEGKVAGCFVLDRTEPDDFASVTCRAISRRAKLQPALDSEGKPVRSYLVESVRFLMSR